MFRGCTTVTMNQATIIEAVQEYLDKRVAETAAKNIVKSVKQTATGYDEGFKVELSEATPT